MLTTRKGEVEATGASTSSVTLTAITVTFLLWTATFAASTSTNAFIICLLPHAAVATNTPSALKRRTKSPALDALSVPKSKYAISGFVAFVAPASL